MLRASLSPSLPSLTTLLCTSLRTSLHIRTMKKLTPAQKYNQRVQLTKIRLEGKQPAPQYTRIPCIDATKLVSEPSKKKRGKPKVYKKKIRFVKNGLDNIQPFYIPSEKSPMYSIIQQARNMFEYSRRESEKQAAIQREYQELISSPTEQKKDDMEADLNKYMVQPESVMSKKEAKVAAKTAKKVSTTAKKK